LAWKLLFIIGRRKEVVNMEIVQQTEELLADKVFEPQVLDECIIEEMTIDCICGVY
jgi:mycofactocin precursor